MNTSNLTRLIHVCCAGLVWLSAVATETAVAQDISLPKIEEVLAKIQARQDRLRTVMVQWNRQKLVMKGSLSIVKRPGEEVGRGPAEDTQLRETFWATLDGDKLLVRQEGVGWQPNDGQFIPIRTSEVWVDGEARSLCDVTGGYIGQRTPMVDELDVLPVFFAYRLFHPQMRQVRPQQFQVIGRGEHQGRPCIVIQARQELADGSAWSRQWWLADDMQYAVVHWESLTERVGEKPTLVARGDLQYESDEAVGWRLTSWDTFIPKEQPVKCTNIVSEFTPNVPIPPETFKINFPVGIRVWDDNVKIAYRVGESGLLSSDIEDELTMVTKGGETPGESKMRSFVDDLRKRSEVSPPVAPRSIPWGVIVICACACAVAVLTAIAIRRRLRSRSRS